MWALLCELVRDDDGQDLVEYAYLLALISITSVMALRQLGRVIREMYFQASNSVAS
jgi:Flp pilus assembly pilin Flp